MPVFGEKIDNSARFYSAEIHKALVSNNRGFLLQDKEMLKGESGVLVATTVAVAGLTTVGQVIDVSIFERLFARISNENASAVVFDAFEVQISPDGTNFETAFSSAGDYTSPAGIMVGCSSDLTTLADAATGWIILNVRGINSVRLQASANTTQSVGVTGTWSAN